MANRSSSVLGHIAKHSVDSQKPKFILYHSCIRLCSEIHGCVAVSLSEDRNECWLKSSVENGPRTKRSFIRLDCIQTPQSILYPGYDAQLKKYFKTEWECSTGYANLEPMDNQCYRFEKQYRPIDKEHVEVAQRRCQITYNNGSLTVIGSKWVKDAHVKAMTEKKLDHLLVMLRMNFGTYQQKDGTGNFHSNSGNMQPILLIQSFP